MTISISASGIALDGPLVAGEKVAVTVSGLAITAEDKPTLALLARFPDALLASVELAEDADAPGTWTGELDTATKQTALFFATARADERRDAALELVSGRVSLARLTVPMANSALCPKPDGSPFASPVYVPVPGPPGTGGDPYDQAPEMDGEASPGTVDEYARGDHRHPTDTTRQAAISDLETIRSGAAAGATAVQPSALATVATSGEYGDLLNTPTIPAAQIQSDWNQTNSAAVDFIKNKPTIPGPAPVTSVNGDTGDVAIYGNTLLMGQGQSTTVSTAIANAQNDATSALNELAYTADSASIAAAFSTSSTYAVGDYCTYQGLLYKCTTAVSTAGAWTGNANWTAVAVTGEMGADTPLPFDAECEYVTFPVGSVVLLDVANVSPDLVLSATVRLPTSGISSTNKFVCGNWRGNSTKSTQIYVLNSTHGNAYNCCNAPSTAQDPGDLIGQFGTIGIRGSKIDVGSTTASISPINSTYESCDIAVGGCAFTKDIQTDPETGSLQFDLASFYYNGSGGIRNLAPVRVGTVGYLYDKISGRLFGSAVGNIPLVPGPDKATPTITTPGRIVELTPAIRYAFASPTPTVSGTSATVACEDRAINDFTVATGITSLTIAPPAAVTGRARDFFCRVTLTDSSLPTVTLSGGTIDIGSTDVAGMAQGVNLLMFTEIASGHWLASRRSAS